MTAAGRGGCAAAIAPRGAARPRLRRIAPAALLLALGACATGPDPVCPTDWRAAGVADGAAGLAGDRFAERAADCAPAAPGPAARAAFAEGLAEGQAAYCMPSAALALGRGGRGLRNVCPDALAETAREYNRAGLSEWDLGQQIVDAQSDAIHAGSGSPLAGIYRSLAFARASSYRRELRAMQEENDAAAARADAAARAALVLR